MNELQEHFSNFSLDNERVQPGDKISCSSTAGWTSLLVQTFEFPANVEPFEPSPTPDQLVALAVKGTWEVERFLGGAWNKAVFRPGVGGMIAAGNVGRVRWQSKVPNLYQTLHIHIPQYFFAAAADEYRRAGTGFHLEQPDTIAFYDPLIFQTALALNEAISMGAPNLYAESVAQFLATHLLSLQSQWSELTSGIRNPGVIPDRRLRRVLEFMAYHYTEDLTLAQIAREAGISRFHFVNLFKKSCGLTPHQYLIRLRMNAAAVMLEDVNLGFKEIAAKCGYANASHFTVAFKKYFLQTPTEYQKNFAHPNARFESRKNRNNLISGAIN